MLKYGSNNVRIIRCENSMLQGCGLVSGGMNQCMEMSPNHAFAFITQLNSTMSIDFLSPHFFGDIFRYTDQMEVYS